VSIECCDPAKLPRAQHGNYLTLLSRAWTSYSTSRPVLGVPVHCQSGTIYARPGGRGDATSEATLRRDCYFAASGVYLPTPGDWYLYSDSAVSIPLVMVDAYDAPAVSMYATPNFQRESGFIAAANARRFAWSHQTPGTRVTGQTSFVATTPTFLLANSAATKCVILRSLCLTQAGSVAGGDISITVAIDSAYRWSTGGTAVVPANTSCDTATASGLTKAVTNPTATAAGAGTRYLGTKVVPAEIGRTTTLEFRDGVIMRATGSIAVYTWAATTGPSWEFAGDWEEF